MRDEEAILDAWSASSQEGVFWIGTDNQIRRINRAAIHILDLPGTPESWLHRPAWDIMASVRETTPHVVDELLAEIQDPEHDRLQPREGRLDNGLRTIHWTSQPIVVPPDLRGHLVVVRDVTGMRLLSEMRHDLLSILEHDVQAPLQQVSDIIAALETADPPATPGHTTHIRSLQQTHKTMATTLARLEAYVEISRLTSGELPLTPSAFALSELVDTVLPACRALAARRDLTVEHRLDPALPPVWGDRGLIQRVLQHLIAHTLQACPPGGRITVQAKIEPEIRGKIRITVGDVASGVSLREGPARYAIEGKPVGRSTAPDNRTPSYDPAFTFCRTVVAAHGERLWVSDKPDSGVVVTFTLSQVSPALQQIGTHTT